MKYVLKVVVPDESGFSWYTWEADNASEARIKHYKRWPGTRVVGTYTKFKITGRLFCHKYNFKAIHTDDFQHVLGINLWRGTKWGWDGSHWRKLWEVYN